MKLTLTLKGSDIMKDVGAKIENIKQYDVITGSSMIAENDLKEVFKRLEKLEKYEC